jgi:broad specificity phosphatase PhoE
MMTTVLLIRHGQTAWNREERFRGQVDLPLNEVGIEQAEAVARRVVGDWQPSAVYASSLQRTLQTAAPVARVCGLQTIIHDGLLDIDYGDLAGLTPEEAAERHPELMRTWRQSPQSAEFPGGEALAGVHRRAEAAISEIVGRHPDGVVVAVTHLVVCRLILCSLLGLGTDHFWQFEPATASLSVFEVGKAGGVLRVFNDTCHLADLHN